MPKTMKDKQIAHQSPKANQIKQQLTEQINASQTASLQQAKNQQQSANPQLIQYFNPPANVMQNMATQSQQINQLFTQQTVQQKLQELQQLTNQLQLEIGKMNTEYNQLSNANMNQTQIQQTLQQKAKALQQFTNEISQKLINL
ncbi:hypothetical protein [Tepidibacillus sp. LV47]|uniref:hypothetical protein n=1 Tax=Tepidibacillus sp. LV47 TaxID=3398228 RepID=UPI003AAF05A7